MRTLLLDLDGFVAHFQNGACDLHGKPRADGLTGEWAFHHKWGITDEQFYAGMGAAFWEGLESWPDGLRLTTLLIDRVGKDRIAFLSSPCRTPGCGQGKRKWFARHFPAFDPWGDLFLGGAKWKLAHPGALLLDDSDSNCAKFRAAGGQAFLIPRPWNAKRDLCGENGLFHVGNVQSWVEALL